MERLIGPKQASFVPNRQIVDNIIIAQKITHSMRNAQGNKKSLAIKVDLEKAYDRIK